MFEEIVAADLVFDHVQLRIAGAAHVDQVSVGNALLSVFSSDPALAVEINPSFAENVAHVGDCPFRLLLGVVLDRIERAVRRDEMAHTYLISPDRLYEVAVKCWSMTVTAIMSKMPPTSVYFGSDSSSYRPRSSYAS